MKKKKKKKKKKKVLEHCFIGVANFLISTESKATSFKAIQHV